MVEAMPLMDAEVAKTPEEQEREQAIEAFKAGTLPYSVYRLLPEGLQRLYAHLHRAPRNEEREAQLKIAKERKLTARKKRQAQAKQARKANR